MTTAGSSGRTRCTSARSSAATPRRYPPPIANSTAIEADLSLARGRVLHARFLSERQEDPRELALFERAAELFQRLGDVRGESEAAFWVGCFHQVVRGDSDLALPFFERSYQLAS
ncbi:MAG TPA: hypothetical protein VGJ38_05780, partial [Jatrophihabitantaceae bacterium]